MCKKIKHLLRDLPLKSYIIYLCVALFLTTGVTFSKYIVSTAAGESAKVAKFGNLTLAESNASGNYNFIYAPGESIHKDPKVSFLSNEMSAYVFVTVTAENWNFSSAFGRYTYTVDNKFHWEVSSTDFTLLNYDDTAKKAVFYKLVPAGQALSNLSVIKNDTITVSDTIKRSEMSHYENYMDISFQAYAIQSSGFETADSAWNSVKDKE